MHFNKSPCLALDVFSAHPGYHSCLLVFAEMPMMLLEDEMDTKLVDQESESSFQSKEEILEVVDFGVDVVEEGLVDVAVVEEEDPQGGLTIGC